MITKKVLHVKLSLILYKSFFLKGTDNYTFFLIENGGRTDTIFFISTLLRQNWAGTGAFDSSVRLTSSLILGNLPFLFYTRDVIYISKVQLARCKPSTSH